MKNETPKIAVHEVDLKHFNYQNDSRYVGCVVEDTETRNKILLVGRDGKLLAVPFVSSGVTIKGELS